jgi:hypothetical protein
VPIETDQSQRQARPVTKKTPWRARIGTPKYSVYSTNQQLGCRRGRGGRLGPCTGFSPVVEKLRGCAADRLTHRPPESIVYKVGGGASDDGAQMAARVSGVSLGTVALDLPIGVVANAAC